VATLSDKIHVKSKNITRQKGHYTSIKRLIHQEYFTIISTYTPQNRSSKYRHRLPELKGRTYFYGSNWRL
jgi:hypothetical protein